MKKALAAALAFAVACAAAQGQEPKFDPETGLPASPAFAFPANGQLAPFWAKRISGDITTSDGVKLRYTALLPKATGKFPVALTLNGYDAGSIGGSAYLKNQTSMSVAFDKRLIEAGYAVMGGALGNVIDRIRFGYVVDFLDVSGLGFPWVFNIADAAINVGVALLILDTLLSERAARRRAATPPRARIGACGGTAPSSSRASPPASG